MLSLLTILLVIGALLLLVGLSFGLFVLLVKLGVIVHEARRPVEPDRGSYSLDQGREVGRDERQN